MKLLRVHKQGDLYSIEALKSIKIWNYRLGNKKVQFHCRGDVTDWKYSCKIKR